MDCGLAGNNREERVVEGAEYRDASEKEKQGELFKRGKADGIPFIRDTAGNKSQMKEGDSGLSDPGKTARSSFGGRNPKKKKV